LSLSFHCKPSKTPETTDFFFIGTLRANYFSRGAERGCAPPLSVMKKRLFVVDDDPAIRKALKKILEDSGYEVILAADGREAQIRLEDPNADLTFDLLIVDLNMPDRDGWDVLEQVNAKHPFMPVIIVTGIYDQLPTLAIPGVAALIKKPVDTSALLKKIEDLLAETPEKRLRRISGYFESESSWPTNTGDQFKVSRRISRGFKNISQNSNHHR
jgi:DNA-binding NtrC family response regulator